MTDTAAARVKRDVMIYPRFERFWRWAQAALILLLLVTGFTAHGTIGRMRFGAAAEWRIYAALALMVLWTFMLFWRFTTGERRNYAPKAGLWTPGSGRWSSSKAGAF